MPLNIPLEDDFRDVIQKASVGLGVCDDELKAVSGLCSRNYAALFSGPTLLPSLSEALEPALARIAARLNLGGAQLLALARGKFCPPKQPSVEGVFVCSSPFGSGVVNATLVWDVTSKKAAVFDSGCDAELLLEEADRHGLLITQIFLTHTHGDHVFDVERLVERTGAAIRTPEKEPLHGAEIFLPDRSFQLGELLVETRPTPGHSPGGTTYFIIGLSKPVAVVGDALFAGSIGGVRKDYLAALASIKNHILSLPEDTLLLPGHGPATTVGYERANNPFFTSPTNNTTKFS